MRSLLVAALATIAIPACTQDITGGGGPGGDDQQQPTCGNGVVDQGETCDDSNTASGDGCSSSCQTESGSSPRLMTSVDHDTVPTALNKTEKIMLTLASVDGFTGTVNIALSSPDNAKVTVTSTMPSVTLAAGDTKVVEIDAAVASDATGTAATANVHIDLTGAATDSKMVALTIDPSFTVIDLDGTSTDVSKHQLSGMSFTVLRGTKIHFKNEDTTPGTDGQGRPLSQHITHGSGGGFDHETISTTTGLTGDDYVIDTLPIAPGSQGQLGCHNHEAAATYINFTVM